MTIAQAREAAKRIIQNREAFPEVPVISYTVLLADFILDHFPEDGEEEISLDWWFNHHPSSSPATVPSVRNQAENPRKQGPKKSLKISDYPVDMILFGRYSIGTRVMSHSHTAPVNQGQDDNRR